MATTFAQTLQARKTVDLELVGLDGNAYALMGAFKRQATRERWSAEEVSAVLDEAMSDDYDHLLQTLVQVCDAK